MSKHRSPYEIHIQSLLSTPEIRSTEWEISISNDKTGSYHLTIKLGKEFPAKPPKVILDNGWMHPMVNRDNGEVVVSELIDEWNEKRPLGELMKDLMKAFEGNPPEVDITKLDGRPQKETIAELRQALEEAENEKKTVDEELTLQQKLVNSLRNELQEHKERAKRLAEKTNIKNDFEKIKVEIEQCKDANKQMDQTIKTKDEIIKGLRSKCAQLTHQAYLQEQATTTEPNRSADIKALEQFNQQLKGQIEDLKKQLVDSKSPKHIDIENTDEFKELNEVNEKLERQNRSLSERIQTLDEKVKGLTQNMLERDATIALLQGSLEAEKKTTTDCDAKIQQHMSSCTTLVEEKNIQIEALTLELQKIENERSKENQAFEEKVQELEKALEELRQESQKEETPDEFVTEKKENDSNAVVIKKLDVEEVMSQLNLEECDLNLKIAQQIKRNEAYRALFQLMMVKLDRFFNDCQVVSSYADMNDELKYSVEAAVAELGQANSTFLLDFPNTKSLTKLNDSFANICKEMELKQLFHNVASFESKLSPQSRMTFAKAFSLRVFSLEIFADNPDLEAMEEKQHVEAEKQYRKQWRLWVEHACERAFVVLAVGAMESVFATKFNNTRVTTIRDLEEIVNDLFAMLVLGKSTAAFQERLKQQLEKEKEEKEKEKEEKEEKEKEKKEQEQEQEQAQIQEQEQEQEKTLDTQPSKEKDDGFELVGHCAVHILKEGWLEKAGEHFFSQNQRRKFTLWSDGSLFYEKGEGKNLMKNKIDLNKAKVVKRVGNFEMIVEMPDRKWEFKCDTINERDGWIHAFTSIKGVKCESCDSLSEQNR